MVTVALELSLGEDSNCCKVKPQVSSVGYPLLEKSSVGPLSYIEEVKCWNLILYQV